MTTHKYLYAKKPDDDRTSIQLLHEILHNMQLDGFTRKHTTIFETGPAAKVEYGVDNPKKFPKTKSSSASWFSRKKRILDIELTLSLRPLDDAKNTVEITSELRELSI